MLLALAAIAFGVGWNPPHDKVHTFSSASDYKVATDSGCTNSGSGCHGAEKDNYRDFNNYHPDTKCGVCHSWQGVACIPCHAPNKNHECALCHDGSMKQAADVVRLTDNYPNGHYRETTHTAMGTKYETPVRAVPDGEASATCADCHSRDLRKAHKGVAQVAGSTYGPDLGCGECHNDVRSYGQAEVVANWKSRSCEACHKVGSSAPMHPATEAGPAPAAASPGCTQSGSGCHEEGDLHSIHVNTPKDCSGSAKKGEPGCHKLGTEALKPTAKTCGSDSDESCHQPGSSKVYRHKNLSEVHSPDDDTAASATFNGVACGRCHHMSSNGKSLVTEHALSTSAKSLVEDDVCRNCHNSEASTEALDNRWEARNSTGACQACHGRAGLASVHDSDVSDTHSVDGSDGCASSGKGCHPTSNLASIGRPTTSSGLHSTCLRCHDRTRSGSNRSYDPSKTTCGAGRDCHTKFNPTSSKHENSDGTDDKHVAGSGQRNAAFLDLMTGISTECGDCHRMTLGTEHKRPNVEDRPKNSCKGCHNTGPAPEVVKDDWPGRNGSSACAACHGKSGVDGMHQNTDSTHIAVELGPSGLPAPGSCVTNGCHTTLDLRKLHAPTGCTTTGCHSADGDIFGRDLKTCGGTSELGGCHAGFSATEHFTSHPADALGTVKGVEYVVGANAGCFGCHAPDLATEHLREFAAGALEGSAANGCRVCHYDPLDSGSGTYSSVPRVRAAIENHDMRCVACHASGTANDTSDAVASPHKNTTTDDPLPVGKVWSDPFEDWKTALDATTGGGHNGLSADLVGAATDKQFPVTEFDIGGTTYTWALPPNSGDTKWIRSSAFPGESLEDTSAIQHLRVHCDDCHEMPENMRGPHGASIHVGIDPDYSQTEYANPTPDAYQFEATGNERVICMKCHDMQASGADNPGGSPLHARHVSHDDLPSSNKHHYGEKCIDCHTRIPHAWRRPRLLVRTVDSGDGAELDEFPYVRAGHDGLVGVVLRDFDTSADLRSRYCATGGCHAGHSATRHPEPSDIPGASYWP